MGHASNRADSPPVDDDLAWCHEVVQDVSRTFAITIDVLEEPASSSICLGYLLCRIPDTVEDAGHIPPAEQVRLLELYQDVLDPATGTSIETFEEAVEPWLPEQLNADWELVADAERVLAVFERQPERVQAAVRPPARELVSGMATFVERYADEGGLRIRTREELHEYCYYVAGTVGELITNLVRTRDLPAEDEAVLEETAESFGRALQLVNVCKDVGVDFREENNVYLPGDELAEHGVSQAEIAEPDNEDGVVAVVERTAEDAREALDDAQRYLEHMPEEEGNLVAAWAIPFLLAVATLREIESRPADVLTDTGVKITRQEVAAVIDATVDGIDADSLSDLRERIAAEPLV